MSESLKRFFFIATIILGICNLIVLFFSWYFKTNDLYPALIFLIPMFIVVLIFYLKNK